MRACISSAIKPCEVHEVMSVGEVGHYPLFPRSHLKRLEAEYLAKYLNVRHLGVHLRYSVNLATVDILIGKGHEQIGESLDAEFVT